MDSLTQITLGAAVGEIVLGRKLGNRAMMWGAIGGTIPDLDIIANFFVDNVTALAFHRGISHSLLFSILAPFPFAWLVLRLYNAKTYRKKEYKWGIFILNSVIGIALGGLISYLGFSAQSLGGILFGSTIVGLSIYFIYRLYKYYLLGEEMLPDVKFRELVMLFFLAFATHWMLDCFTAYGTQVFQPFSDYRVAFNNISVADPLYTIPFLLCIIVAAFFHRTQMTRRKWVIAGIAVSSLYMMLTIFNKISVDRFFEKSLQVEGIDAIRYRTSPSILNNVVWGCVAETDSAYFIGLHSIFDQGDRLPVLNKVAKNHDRLKQFGENKQIEILKWFTDGYYSIYNNGENEFVLADLRYGAITDHISGYNDFVFKFFIQNTANGVQITESRERPDDPGKLIKDIWSRMKGRSRN